MYYFSTVTQTQHYCENTVFRYYSDLLFFNINQSIIVKLQYFIENHSFLPAVHHLLFNYCKSVASNLQDVQH